ncbi:unnamed protein product [Candida verbasci]|uniref:ATPase expression protein 1 n=1 Tax=Candida verbasci TaxID=1227364 RepID=A0A9W4XNN7_9ASCO|nr:unnamed protein product [Candida verbasci]
MKQIIRNQLIRNYSNKIDFISNEVKHIFEVEKLTPEENLAAIPKKPIIPKNITKFQHSIIKPKDVLDLYTKFNLNDVLISILSKSKKLHGVENFQIVSKDGIIPNIYFPNSAIILKWIKAFNKKIYSLKPIPVENYINTTLKNAELEDLVKQSSFDKIFNIYRVIKSSRDLKYGNRVEENAITLNNLSMLVLNQSNEVIENYLEYLMELTYVQYFTLHGLKDFINQLSLNGDILNLNEFIIYLNGEIPQLFNHMSSESLDKISGFIENKEISRNALEILIKRGYLPSESSINNHLKHYINENDPVRLTTELTFLKPVFHKFSNELIVSILLKTITNIIEFDKFIQLLKSFNDPNLLNKYQLSLFKKLMLLKPTKLEIAQFVNISKSNKIEINQEIMEILNERFK